MSLCPATTAINMALLVFMAAAAYQQQLRLPRTVAVANAKVADMPSCAFDPSARPLPAARAPGASERPGVSAPGRRVGQPFTPPYEWGTMQGAYNRDGFVLVSGLVDPEAMLTAEDVVWATVEREQGWQRHNASSWPSCGSEAAEWVDGAAIAPLFSRRYLEVAHRLSSDYPILPGTPASNLGQITFPRQDAMSINVFPCPSTATPWTMPPPHLDHCNKDDFHQAFPHRPVRMSSMTYLTDTRATALPVRHQGHTQADDREGWHGGGTIVWPGSARRVESLSGTNPARFSLMWALGEALSEAGVGGDCQPLELKPDSGDVLFYDIFLAHSGSQNRSPRPRLAVNMKWGTGVRTP